MNDTSNEWNISNGSYSIEDCLIENFGKTTIDCSNCFSLKDTPEWMLVLHAMVILVLIGASLISSSLVLLLVAKYKKLRTHAVIVSLSIIFVDVALVFSYHFPAFVSTVTKHWPFNFGGCLIFGFLSITFILIRWNSMAILAIDRFCTVRFPFSYNKYKRVILIVLIAAAWVVPMLSSATIFNGFASVSFRQNVPTCLFYAPTLNRGIIYSSIINTLSFAIGAVLPTILYVWLYYRAWKLRPAATQLGELSVEIAGSVISLPLGQRQRENNFRETRALLTFALIFVSLFVTGIPSYLFQMIRWISLTSWCEIPIFFHFIVVDIFQAVTVLDPILLLRDRDFRIHIKYLFCGKPTHTATTETNHDAVESEQTEWRSLTSLRSRTSSIVSLSHYKDTVRNGTKLQKVAEEEEETNEDFTGELILYYKNTNSSKPYIVVSYRKRPLGDRYRTTNLVTNGDICNVLRARALSF